MLKFTIKRVLYSILILFFVMFLIYILMYNMPMGYIETKARELASRPGATKSYAEWLADLNAQYGMDKGVVLGYLTWLKNAFKGNWGTAGPGRFRLRKNSTTQSGTASFWDSFLSYLRSSSQFRSESPRPKSSTASRITSRPSFP